MANLLDLFAVGFNSDGIKEFEQELKSTESKLKTAEKKVKDLENSLEELRKEGKEDTAEFKKLSAQLVIAESDVKKFSDSLKTMQGKNEYQLLTLKKNFVGVAKAVTKVAAVAVAVKKSMQFYEQADQLDFLSKKADVAVESIQRLGNASARYGGSVTDTASTVGQFRTQDFKDKAAKSGISIGASPEQTLENIALKMQSLKNDAEKIDLADNLGLDEGTTRLLIQGVERYREELKRANKYKLYTKEDIERMKDYQQVQQDIRLGVQSIWGSIARLLLPALTQIAKVIKGVTDWLAEHEGAVKMAAVFIAVASAIGLVTGAVKLLNIALGLMLANPVALTIIAWTAAIGGIIVALQDLFVWLSGGNSVIGKFIDNLVKFLHLKELATKTRTALGEDEQSKKRQKEKSQKNQEWIAKQIQSEKARKERLQNTVATVKRGQQQLNQANNNPLNSVPAGTISNYYSTQAINNNNSANTNSIVQNKNNKGVNIGTINVQTQATDGKGLAQELAAITEQDNGFLV